MRSQRILSWICWYYTCDLHQFHHRLQTFAFTIESTQKCSQTSGAHPQCGFLLQLYRLPCLTRQNSNAPSCIYQLLNQPLTLKNTSGIQPGSKKAPGWWDVKERAVKLRRREVMTLQRFLLLVFWSHSSGLVWGISGGRTSCIVEEREAHALTIPPQCAHICLVCSGLGNQL